MQDTTQHAFDGGTIPDKRMNTERKARNTWGFTREQAAEWYDRHESTTSEWDTLLDYDEAADIDPYDVDIASPGAVAWILEETDVGIETAIAYEGLAIEDITEGIIEATEPPEEWTYLDPTQVEPVQCVSCDHVMYHVEHTESCWVCGSHECYIDDRGDVIHGEHVGDPSGCYYDTQDRGRPLCGGCYESFGEYSDTLVGITEAGEKTRIEHMDGVVCNMPLYANDSDVDAYDTDVGAIMYDIAAGEGLPDTWTAVKSGWHSSMERSDVSDAINALSNGEYHRHAGFDFPLIIRYGKTTNVCTLSLTVMVPQGEAETIEALFKGKHGIGNFR